MCPSVWLWDMSLESVPLGIWYAGSQGYLAVQICCWAKTFIWDDLMDGAGCHLCGRFHYVMLG
jgi:hypothetical protein